MKKAIMILMTISTIGILSCKKTDTTEATTAAYDSKWSLVSYNQDPMMGGSSTVTYTPGDIVWDFNSTNQTVVVSVNPILSTIPLGSGSYVYQLGNHSCNYGTNQFLSINTEDWGVFVLDDVANNKLKITAECLDGAILEFER